MHPAQLVVSDLPAPPGPATTVAAEQALLGPVSGAPQR